MNKEKDYLLAGHLNFVAIYLTLILILFVVYTHTLTLYLNILMIPLIITMGFYFYIDNKINDYYITNQVQRTTRVIYKK